MSPEEIRSAYFQQIMLAPPRVVRIDDPRLVEALGHHCLGVVRIGWYDGIPYPEIHMLTHDQVRAVEQVTGILS